MKEQCAGTSPWIELSRTEQHKGKKYMNRMNLLVVSYLTNHHSDPVKSRVVFSLAFVCLFSPLPITHSQTDEEYDGNDDWVDNAAAAFGPVMISTRTNNH